MGGPGMIYVGGPNIGSTMRLGAGKGQTDRRNYDGNLDTVGGIGH